MWHLDVQRLDRVETHFTKPADRTQVFVLRINSGYLEYKSFNVKMIGWQLKINTSEAILRDNILIHILFFLFLNKPCL